MECEKNIYFSKTDMSNQLVPSTSTIGINLFSESYDSYADSFDLSLLPSDCDISLNFSQQQPNQHSPLLTFDYMPETIYNDQLNSSLIKIEKSWQENDISNKITDNNFTLVNESATSSILYQQLQKQYQFYPSPLPSPPQYDTASSAGSICSPSSSSTYPPSPCPSLEQNFNNFQIKQEFLILPPSPPESQGSPSPCSEIKSEPDCCESENLIDINSLLEKSVQHFDIINKDNKSQQPDHQLLREYLQDTTFQKKHNLKPLALESLIGGLGERGDIEPVISLALEHAKRDAQATCANLQISQDPKKWTPNQVHAWIRSTIEQFNLKLIDDLELKFNENGANLLCLSEDEFVRRLPESGGTIHAQLEIWKLACCDNFANDISSLGPSTSTNWSPGCPQNMEISEDEEDDLPSSITIANNNIQAGLPATSTSTSAATSPLTAQTPTIPANGTVPVKAPRTGGSHIHLWQFLKELLNAPQVHGTAIRWLDRNKGVFKIEDSVRVAKLWGRRKNRPAMNYDKLSRSIRQYYKKGIMKKTERSQRLVYQFCHPYCI